MQYQKMLSFKLLPLVVKASLSINTHAWLAEVILTLNFWKLINCFQQLGLKKVLKKRGCHHLASTLYGYPAGFLALIGRRV